MDESKPRWQVPLSLPEVRSHSQSGGHLADRRGPARHGQPQLQRWANRHQRDLPEELCAQDQGGAPLLAGCVSKPYNSSDPILEFAKPSEIIVGAIVTGRIDNIDGCLLLTNKNWRKLAIFPIGSTLGADGKSISLPSGAGVVRFGRIQMLAYEAPPLSYTPNPCHDRLRAEIGGFFVFCTL